MSKSEFEEVYEEIRKSYPPLISVEQAAKIAQVPKATIHAWSSAGCMDRFKVRRGRRILFSREGFLGYLLFGNEPASNQ